MTEFPLWTPSRAVKRCFQFVARIRSLSAAMIILAATWSSPAFAYYWSTGLVNPVRTVTCQDGFTCALLQINTIYPWVTVDYCKYTYTPIGKLAGAECWGHSPNMIPQPPTPNYLGSAVLHCDPGEVSTATGCVTSPPPEKNPSCKDERANPVDARSGTKKQYAIDFSTGGEAPLKFERYYNSDLNYLLGDNRFRSSRFGNGWRSNFDSAAFYEGNPTSGNVSANFVLPTGEAYRFHYSSGSYKQSYLNWGSTSWVTGIRGRSAALSKNTTTQRYTLTTDDDTSWTYDYAGKLVNVTSRSGYSQDLAYTGDNNTSVTDSFGRTISFAYDSLGLLTSMTVPGGQTYEFAHVQRDAGGAFSGVYVPPAFSHRPYWTLEYVIQPDLTPVTNADNPRTRYHYEDANFAFALTGITDERNVRYATWTYDAQGRVATSEHAGGVDLHTFTYDTVNNTATVVNPLGKSTVYHYTPDIRKLPQLTHIEGVASTNCVASNGYLSYNSSNHVTDETDEEGRITHYTRDSRGNPTSIVRAYGTPSAQTNSVTWHASLNVPTQIVKPGLTTSLTWTSGQLTDLTQTDTTSQTVPYSTNGQTRSWAFTYTTGGLLASVDGPLAGSGDTVSYTYNGNGFLQTVTNEVGHVTTVTAWNGRGQPTSVTDPNGVVSSMTYDEMGRLTSTTLDPGGAAAATLIDYTAAGDVAKITRPNGAFLQYTRNDARRITKIEDNTGASIEYDHDDLGGITQRRIKDAGATLVSTQNATYDELGRLLTFVGASSQTWTHAYDRTDNLTAVTDPRTNTFQRAFDGINRLVGETDEASKTVSVTRNGQDEITQYTDPRSNTTSYVRNGFGDIIQRTSPDTGTTVYTYNALGKPTQITDGRGVVTNLTYDNADRLLTKEYPADTAENITYIWDSVTGGNKGVGRITRIDDASGSIEWTYNVLGQATLEKKTTASQVYPVDYTHDLGGNVTQMVYPSGRIVTYTRDAIGQITGVTTKKDALSSTVTLASGAAYLPFGGLTSLTYGNTLTLTKTFNADYNLTALAVMDGGTAIVNRSYAYGYGDFDLTGITDAVNAGRSETYTYTANHWLASATGSWGSLSFSMDDTGNRTQEVHDDTSTVVTRDYATTSTDNLLDTVTQGATTLRSFTHDGAGNVTADTRGATTYNYRTNNRGRMDRLTVGSTVTADYTYDGLERLAIRTTQNMVPASTTHYVYDRSGKLIAEATAAGATATEYIWLDDMPLAVIAGVDTMSPQLWYVHADHLNRPTRMTDGGKAVVWDAWYWPFGEARAITGTATNNMRFPGQYFLVESGLAYNWHRHYDPTLGRYLQADPLQDVLMMQPMEAYMPNLTAIGRATESVSQLGNTRRANAFAPSEAPESQIGQELPRFIDGSAIYNYAKIAPIMNTDVEGLQLQILGPGGGGRICGIICGGYGLRIDYGPNPSPSRLHLHCGPLSAGGSWGGHRPWFAPWRVY